MSKYQKQTMVGGKWAKASELSGIKGAVIVSPTEPTTSGTFKNKDGSPKVQNVCKVRFDGQADPLNVSLNRATINALVDAFGEESADWMNKPLSVETEKTRVAGKSVTALYLIPEGYEKLDDEDGYAIIVKEGTDPSGGAGDDDEE